MVIKDGMMTDVLFCTVCRCRRNNKSERSRLVIAINREMQLPQLLFLTCCTYCVIRHCSSFELPRFDDIAQTFGDLLRKVRSASTDTSGEEVVLEDDDKAQVRSKRQTSNIGDESPLPHEIRSSRLEAVLFNLRLYSVTMHCDRLADVFFEF